MSWSYVLTPPAQQDLRRLDGTTRRRVRQTLRLYTDTGRGDVVKLQGRQDEWRLRVGEQRVRFRRDTATQTVLVLRVRHRREAY